MNTTHNTQGITRDEAIAILVQIDGASYNPADYKGKRVKTLIAIIDEKTPIQGESLSKVAERTANNEMYDTESVPTSEEVEAMGGDELYGDKWFDEEIAKISKDVPPAQMEFAMRKAREQSKKMVDAMDGGEPKKPAKKSSKLTIADMTDAQILENLTVRQRLLLDVIIKLSSLNLEIQSNELVPIGNAKEAFAIGGVITTLIQKGILTRMGKSFMITDRFQFLVNQK